MPRSEYAVELDLYRLHAALGFAVVFCGERALQPHLLRLAVVEHARNRLLKVRWHLLAGFIRAVSVPVQSHPERHLPYHWLIPPWQDEALDAVDLSGMTGFFLS